jgi:hypothetical protein
MPAPTFHVTSDGPSRLLVRRLRDQEGQRGDVSFRSDFLGIFLSNHKEVW